MKPLIKTININSVKPYQNNTAINCEFTVGPLKRGHFGTAVIALSLEVVLFLEVVKLEPFKAPYHVGQFVHFVVIL